ncbi:flagellar biosynthetic protein FliS [Desulfocapsa sulfexigens DSM 10523]|uniref:Flagellar secretion chaperone FliS n=1 Tax=Desulfocapsa sulfexigens (strain DSM 10523 / SB164P1) TaxID=1167006 RepID=M1PTH6_DESSD|nr:flagellar export chaperone FliS [Desulfocapsa sulfexigens]AGF79641.1 flagellar biosynthetic protein FliS [Desulfocapsa sulfexigens DSM 10523]
MNPYNHNQYQQNQINTASPEQILLMLYDGAIRFTREAIIGVEENRPELRVRGVSKALAIVVEFSNTLNHEIGGKIAEDLHDLYDFMIRELTSANISNDLTKLQNVEKLLVDLRQTWGEAVVINKKEKAAAEAESAVLQKKDYTYEATYSSFAVSS